MRAALLLAVGSSLACGNSRSADGDDTGANDASVEVGEMDSAVDSGDVDEMTDVRTYDGNLPDVPLPPPPAVWDPPFSIAPGGWRESEEPVCADFSGNLDGFSVWSDARGVFALARVANNSFDFSHPPTPSGSSLLFNDATGWVTWETVTESPGVRPPGGLTGFPGEPLWVWGGTCTIRRVSGPGESVCEYVGEVGDRPVVDIEAVAPDFAWALTYGILVNDGDEWIRIGSAPRPSYTISGNRAAVLVLANSQLHTVVGRPRTDLPEGMLSALQYGTGDIIWSATVDGRLLRFQGTEWTEHATGLSGAAAIQFLSVGTDETYFASTTAFGVVSDEEVRIIAQWESFEVAIESLHADAATGELFLAVQDRRYWANRCGGSFLIWYDGEVLRRF